MPFEQSRSTSTEAINLMKQRLSGFETEKGRLSGLDYKPKSTDEVFITTTPKAGTTWMQQICHQLRSADRGGDMSFEEISEVVPWLELAHDQGQDLYAPQYGEAEGKPRIFKTHAWEGHCPKAIGCKKVVVLRNPFDVVVSFYKFFENWFFEEGSVSLDDFAREFWLGRGVPESRMNNASYFVHLASWYEHRQDPDVLIVFFEDMKDDLRTQVRKVAQFISTEQHDFASNEEHIQTATEKASYNFMKEHESQFDEKLSKLARNEACGLPKDAGMNASKLNKGTEGVGRYLLSDELQKEIDATWRRVVEPETGCATYEELRKSWHEEQQKGE